MPESSEPPPVKTKDEDSSVNVRLNKLEEEHFKLKQQFEFLLRKIEELIKENNRLKRFYEITTSFNSIPSLSPFDFDDCGSETRSEEPEENSQDRNFIEMSYVNDVPFLDTLETDGTYDPEEESEQTSLSTTQENSKLSQEIDDVEMLSKSISNIKVTLN